MMEWQSLFEPRILERGLDYYQMGHVTNVIDEAGVLSAIVTGTQDYEVELDLSEEDNLGLFCECPYAADLNTCKHMAAVFFAWENGAAKEVSVFSKSELEKAIAAADEVTLRAFLLESLQQDQSLAQRFMGRIQKSGITSKTADPFFQVNQIVDRYTDYSDYINYDHAFGFAADLSAFLDTEVQSLIDEERYHEAFDLTNAVFQTIGEVEIDDSNGEIVFLGNECYEIWQRILSLVDPDTKNDMFIWFSRQLAELEHDFLLELIQQIIAEEFQELNFAEQKLRRVEEMLEEAAKQNDFIRDYSLASWGIIKAELLEQLGKPDEEIEAFYRSMWNHNEIRQRYIKRCIDQKNFYRAIEVLKESIILDKEYRGLVSEYSIQLKNLYLQLGEKEAYVEQLYHLIYEDDPGSLETFRELKQLYSTDEWRPIRDKIFNKLAGEVVLDDLYVEEQCYDLLMEEVEKSFMLYKTQSYLVILKDRYPERLLEKYKKEIRGMLHESSSRKKYRDIVYLLQDMKKIPDGKKVLADFVQELKTTYPRRPALLEELERV
ncbi:SWIM zinc finger family protein [Candidatus Enterococcus murrayae]|uniref:SWIM zinc finger family protein n=1 Tax=Candidatus Enterococcus murrayae TaxID=2815321 RepID=A0ABS3HMK9_9ENTE|nr:SWIM zinc finger family protein [Enterococcus sp. MJM16]MBO0454154.1 SWIM zinc finger family protein [Enterococcus sp. MJM16]